MQFKGVTGSASYSACIALLSIIGGSGCFYSGGFFTIDALDVRTVKHEPVADAQNMRIVLGVDDFEGQFSECFRKDEPLDPYTRAEWRKMGTVVFANDVAKHLSGQKAVLDARRANIQTADLILRAKLDVFQRDNKYDWFSIGGIVTFHKWTMQSKIDGDFSVVTPANEVIHKFKIQFDVPPQVTNKTAFLSTGLAGTPKEVDQAYGQVSRQYYEKLLNQVADEIRAGRSQFGDLERPDLDVAQGTDKPILTGKPRNQWAVIIGVSQYAKGGTKFRDLLYADRDATEFCNFLTSPAGGEFSKENVKFLKNADATRAAIHNALFTFLKSAEEDDLVVIYFSGHGAPDPDRPDNLYLLPYDVDPSDISATGFPMWDLEKVLYQTLRAQRVLVFADACHSGGVGAVAAGAKGASSDVDVYDRYYKRLGNTNPGRVILASSAGNEVSIEDAKWDRHGVFTWALLEGLRGKADGYGGRAKDGIVSVFELIQYVTNVVYDETAQKQHPLLATSPKYDHDLPLGIVGAQAKKAD